MSRAVDRWPPFAVTSLTKNLNVLQELTRDVEKNLEPESRSWLAKLLVIRSAGIIEQTVAECSRAYVYSRSGGWVQSFAHSWLERTKNPSPENLQQFLGRFDQKLCDEFHLFLTDDSERLYRDLAFLVDRRNRIAHGLSEGVGPQRALELSEAAVSVADWFVLKLNPKR